MFQGLLRCSECGDVMYTVPGGKAGPQKDYYYCRRKSSHFKATTGGCISHYMHRHVVEETILEFIGRRLADEQYVLGLVSTAYKVDGINRAERNREELVTALSKLDRSQRRTIELYTDGIINRAELDAKLAMAKQHRENLERRMAAISSFDEVRPEAVAEVAAQVAKNFALFRFWTPEDQRKYLRSENPIFWFGDKGVTRFALPSGLKMSSHKGTGSWPPRA